MSLTLYFPAEVQPWCRGRGGAPGQDRGSHAHKDKHKAAIANHHRKDRALRKQGGPVPGGS